MKKIVSLVFCFLVTSAQATLIDFTGGTAQRCGGAGSFVTDDVTPYDFQCVDSYTENGFRFDFANNGDGFSTSVGNYFNNGTDVFHGHAPGLSLITLSAIDGSLFSLESFRLTTLVDTWSVNALSDGVNVSASQLLPEEAWGAAPGQGTNPLIVLGAGFTNVKSITFTGLTGGIGFDDFSVVKTSVPEPTSVALLALSIAGIGFARRQKNQSKT